jgi:urea transporter
MRCSTKSLMLYTTAVCVSLSLTWLHYNTGAIIVGVITLALASILPFSLWWRIVVWSVVSIGAFFIVTVYRCVEKYASTYNEAANAEAFYQWWLPYVVQLGWLAGVTLAALHYAKSRSAKAVMG